MIWSHVTGCRDGSMPAFWATDLRYQSSCVLAQNGAATSWLFHVDDAIGPGSTPAVRSVASAPSKGRRKPAAANSGTNTGSRLIRSIEASLAASRRTSCSRWGGASLGRVGVLIRFAPFDAAEHLAASSAWPPLSGLMYQFRVAVPEPPPPPQAPSTVANRTRVIGIGHFVRCPRCPSLLGSRINDSAASRRATDREPIARAAQRF